MQKEFQNAVYSLGLYEGLLYGGIPTGRGCLFGTYFPQIEMYRSTEGRT